MFPLAFTAINLCNILSFTFSHLFLFSVNFSGILLHLLNVYVVCKLYDIFFIYTDVQLWSMIISTGAVWGI